MVDSQIEVVVFCNRKDFFFTKLCVASIRYFYPDVPIYIVKDNLNGSFSSSILEKKWNVQVLDLEMSYYGWAAARIHFLLSKKVPTKRYLCLDSDIVFVGPLLDRLNMVDSDFILHKEIYPEPFTEQVKQIFIDPVKVQKVYPEYVYPGYFFNSGQMVATPGLLTEKLLEEAFNPHQYPYYRKRDVFPLVDQGVLNAVIPIAHARKNLTLSLDDFMLWSVSFFEDKAHNSPSLLHEKKFPYLVHYAGDLRIPHLSAMKGNLILEEFRKFYESKLSLLEKIFDGLQDKISQWKWLTRLFFLKNRLWIEVQKKLKKG